jgi:hypothetical protein
MDSETLNELLLTVGNRQFWIKPVGIPDQEPDERRLYANETMRIEFAKNPTGIMPGDILIVYRIKVSKVLYVGEALSQPFKASDEQIRKEPWRVRWPWIIEARNLTPIYGAQWAKHSLKPFMLAKEYNALNPHDTVKLGGLNFGSGKLRISPGFGKSLVNRIMQLRES